MSRCGLCVAFSVKGPCQARIECHDNEDGTANVVYHPSTEGQYAVHVLCDGDDVIDSPFMADIRPASSDCDPRQVKAIHRHFIKKKYSVSLIIIRLLMA